LSWETACRCNQPVLLDLLERSLPQRAQESLETVIALSAVAMVTFLFA